MYKTLLDRPETGALVRRQDLQTGHPIGGAATACVTAMGLRPEVEDANLDDCNRWRLCENALKLAGCRL